MKIVGIIFGLLTALFAWNAVSNFRDAFTMRKYPAQVVASKLKVDYGYPDSDSQEQPLYTLLVDFISTEGSNRTFHWEGDPGQAVYPEEAFDELARFAPGTSHNLSVLRSHAREIRFDEMETNLEVTKGIAWTCCCLFFALITWGLWNARKLGKRGPWAVFVAFGMMPLLGAIPVGWFAYERMTTWQQVTVSPIGERKAFDPTQPLPNVEFTAKALEKLPEKTYQRFEFPFNGRMLHGGYAGWHGSYDVAFAEDLRSFYINPKNRWTADAKLDWVEDFWVPFGILMLFGVVFTGAGLLIKKMKM